jgi:hypothetical protein
MKKNLESRVILYLLPKDQLSESSDRLYSQARLKDSSDLAIALVNNAIFTPAAAFRERVAGHLAARLS